MKSFKEFLIEGVFAVHNAHVMHKALMKHVKDNEQIVSNHFRNRRTYTVNAKKLNPNFDDIDIHLDVRKAPKGHSSDLHSGGGFYPGYHPGEKPQIKMTIGFEHDQHPHVPDHIHNQLAKPENRGIFVHEFNHFADAKDKEKAHGRTATIASHHLAYLAAKSKDPDEYFNNPGEVRSYQRELAYVGREKKKTGEHKSTRDFVDQINPVHKQFLSHTKEKNSSPLVDYLLRIHK